MTPRESTLHKGATYMVVGAGLFLAYAVAFLVVSLTGDGFEIGVPTLNGVTPADLNALNPGVMAYITHIHLALSGFIAATAVAVMALCWFGVRQGDWRTWLAAMISPVIGLIVALPMHYTGAFDHNWVTHIGPIYLGTLIFVGGGLLALSGLMKSESTADV